MEIVKGICIIHIYSRATVELQASRGTGCLRWCRGTFVIIVIL